MLETSAEIAEKLGAAIRQRRIAFALTQADAAARAGVSYRTWRRMEAEGKASIDDLVRAAVALRCEQGLTDLFPEAPAASMDDLLERQRAQEAAAPKKRQRASSRRTLA